MALLRFEGLISASTAADPVSPSNTVAKLVKGASGQPWAGATIYTTAGDQSVAAVGLSSSKIITLRVYAPAAGQPITLKLETAANADFNVLKTVNTTVANTWETLTFDFNSPTQGSIDPTKTYNKVNVFPNYMVAITGADATYYFDNLTYAVAATPAPAPAPAPTPAPAPSGSTFNYATNYADSTGTTPWKSTQGGNAGRYIDDTVVTQDRWHGTASADATPSFYFGYGTNINSKPWGFGAFVNAPNNGTAMVGSYASVKIAVWSNDELFSTHPNIAVILKGPATAASCTPELQGNIAVSTPGAQTYTLPLSSFTFKTACGFASTTQALATGVNEVHLQVLGNNLQYLNTAGDPVYYPNGINVGPITFQ